jgi:hypothetical protein
MSRVLLGAALGIGCAPAPSAPPPPAGWVGRVVADPDRLTVLVAEAPEAWIRGHAGRYVPPTVGAPCPGWMRAQAEVEDELGRLTAEVLQALAQTWAERGALPADSPLPALGALAAADQGLPVTPWIAARLGPGWAAPAPGLTSGVLLEPMRACADAHAQARASGAAEPADGACPPGPWPDPWARGTRAAALRACPEASGDAALVFTARWADDPAEDAALRALAADPYALEAEAARFDAALRTGASAAAVATLDELALVAGWRARAAASGAPPDRAAALPALRLAVDAAAGGSPGPTNPPQLLAALARAQVATGDVRGAATTLYELDPHWVGIGPLRDATGDLHVAREIGRDGDSKEL